MEVFHFPATSSEITLRIPSMPSEFTKTRRIDFFPPLKLVGDSRSGSPDPESRNRMFILGMGFVGGFFAEKLKDAGWAVSGSCRSDAKKMEFQKRGIDVHLFSAAQPQWRMLEAVKDFTHLLVSIPPLADIGDPMLRHEELLRSQLSGGNLQWLCYLSSTSVYGDCGGEWINEDYLPNPKTHSSKMRLDSEKGWLDLGRDLGVSTQILRLGGIYGPGRSAIDTLIKQEPLSKAQKRRASRKFTSRVHVDDICQALQAAIEKPSPGEIYNIVDDDPAQREEVFAYALELIKNRWPGKIKQNPSLESFEATHKESSLRGEKRVSNSRMKSKLGVKLHYPSYKSGLRSIVEKMDDNPFDQISPSGYSL